MGMQTIGTVAEANVEHCVQGSLCDDGSKWADNRRKVRHEW